MASIGLVHPADRHDRPGTPGFAAGALLTRAGAALIDWGARLGTWNLWVTGVQPPQGPHDRQR